MIKNIDYSRNIHVRDLRRRMQESGENGHLGIRIIKTRNNSRDFPHSLRTIPFQESSNVLANENLRGNNATGLCNQWLFHSLQHRTIIKDSRYITRRNENQFIIGSGRNGVVYDSRLDGFVVKKFNNNISFKDAYKECELFNRYYGKDSAHLVEKDGNYIIRMRKIPGIPLSCLSETEMPNNFDELYYNMICDMGEKKIIHFDLHAGNILYDKENNKFWPIDFTNIYDEYYDQSTSPEKKKGIDLWLGRKERQLRYSIHPNQRKHENTVSGSPEKPVYHSV